MALRVYNTLTREKSEFQPLAPPKVTMYLCGPTVYKPAHIGHMVGPVIFDTIKRYLTYCGYDVTFVVNITDVDDKLIVRAQEKGTTVKALAEQMTADYFDNLKLMGVDSIDHFPYATDYITAMQEMIQGLIDKGHAYPLDGDVYFRVLADDDYGKLSHRSVEQVLSGTRVEGNDRKENPADFALWKSSKPGEPAWDSPWGPGRPGWHIECSAMSSKLLGDTIDIHGGGLDLMFPHHENELAQSECASGRPFVRYWLHNGLMQSGKNTGKVGGAHSRHGDAPQSSPLSPRAEASGSHSTRLDAASEARRSDSRRESATMPSPDDQIAGKLAGSAGAESVKTAVFAHHPPEVVRFFLLSTHYRSPIDFSLENIAEREKGMEGFYRMFETFEQITGTSFYALAAPTRRAESASQSLRASGTLSSDVASGLCDLADRFLEDMDDDFNTGGAIGVLFDLRKAINGYVAANRLTEAATAEQKQALTMMLTLFKELSQILGVFRQPLPKAAGASDELVDGLMQLIIDIRQQARQDKNWAVADKVRDALKALNITLEDGRDGVRWSRG